MLALWVALEIIFITTCICTSTFSRRNFKKTALISFVIMGLSASALIICLIAEICNDASNPVIWINLGIFIPILTDVIFKYFNFYHRFKTFANMAMLVAMVICLILLIVSCSVDCGEFVECKTHVTTSTVKILSATDGTMVNGSMSGSGFLVWHVSGSVSEKPVYRYYYQIADGGMKLGEIPAKSTTIYYIEDGKEPYIEVITSIPCDGFYSNYPDNHNLGESSTTYKLYVPKGSILENFQFDGS